MRSCKWTDVVEPMKTGIELSGAYCAWIVTHTLSANAYTRYCAPVTFSGLVASPFLTPAPHCRGLLWLTSAGAASIDAMWVAVSTWCAAKVFRKFWE
jgi:hypothetical protein